MEIITIIYYIAAIILSIFIYNIKIDEVFGFRRTILVIEVRLIPLFVAVYSMTNLIEIFKY